MQIRYVLHHDVYPMIFAFEMSWPDFRKHFDEGKMSLRFKEPERNLTSFLAEWITKNTIFYLDEIISYLPGNSIAGWKITLKR